MQPFIHLHGHSFFSNLLAPDALPSPEEIVERAKELGLPAIALTDHASVTGIPRFAKACKEAGIKPIVGSELYVCDMPTLKDGRDYQHLVAIAMNWDGLIELFGLLTKANHADQFHYKPRNSYHQILETKNLIFTTACAGGVLKREDYRERIMSLAPTLNQVGEPQRLFLEIQPHWDEGQIRTNQRAVELHRELGIPLVATQDFHYAKPDQNIAHEIILAIGTATTWNDPKRWKYPVDDLYIKDMGQMAAAFTPMIKAGHVSPGEFAEAVLNTRRIADRTAFEWRELEVSLPKMSEEPERALMELCVAGMKRKGLLGQPEYVERLRYEFQTIKDSGFLTYFLVLEDVVNWAKQAGIAVGPGRGSAGGSLVCYLIGITSIDPIKHGLLFERFYRPGRVDLPDIDIDFEDERRDEVLTYVRKRFGEEYVSGVATYTLLGAKSAIKDVARVFGVDHREANMATAPVDALASEAEVFAADTVKPLLEKYPLVGRYARELVGWMRGTGQHAAGVVIAGVPLAERGVVSYRDERAIVCWDKRVIEEMGLMKLDVLGLRTLSILRNAAGNVKARRGIDIDFEQIPLDDPKTLQVFQEGATTGVFQFESRGMRELLRSLNIDRFSVIADATSLYRPGPMDLIPIYTAAQTGKSRVFYDHPIMETVLAETFGVMIYQEQLMATFSEVGGFSYAEADIMRKIVGKKLGPDEFKSHEGDFVEGAKAKGVDETIARRIFGSMVKFAGYGFNKSHAHAYSMISFWCAFMKAHYPAEFFAAHISNSDDEKTSLAVDEARKLGIKVLMPDVNFSDATAFTVYNDTTIQAPISAIKGVGEKAANLIVGARKGLLDHQGLGPFDTREEKRGTVAFDGTHCRTGQFIDMKDFQARVYKRIVNSRVMRNLEGTAAFPWHEKSEEEIQLARAELLGHIFKPEIAIEADETIKWDGETERVLSRVFAATKQMAVDHKLTDRGELQWATSAYGGKPRVALVFDKGGFADFRKNAMGHSKDFDYVKALLKKEMGMTLKDLYITAIYKVGKHPLGFEALGDEPERLLKEELRAIKAPVTIAFGKGPVELLAGKGARVGEMNGRIVMWDGRPVICAMSPWSVLMEMTAENQGKMRAFVETLRSVY